VTTHNVFFWLQSSTSGSAQINQGPFHLGSIGRLLKTETHGQINLQGGTFGSSSVFSDPVCWGLQVVDHGASPLDLITSLDNDQWLIRQQTDNGDTGYSSTWSPSTDTAAALSGLPQRSRWRGNYVRNADTDIYLSWALPFSGTFPNFNSYGVLRAWWF
jgi:hypothetical protein